MAAKVSDSSKVEAAIDATEAAFVKSTKPCHEGKTEADKAAETSEKKAYTFIKLSNNGHLQTEHVPFGQIAGCAPSGVPAYSNGSDTHFSNTAAMWSSKATLKEADGTLKRDFYTGFEWQCVEYARRWLLQHRGILLPDIQIAAHIIYLQTMIHVPTNKEMFVRPVFNGTRTAPTAGSMIIYPQSNENFVGHVGIITEATETYVRVADQNRFFHNWGNDTFSAEFIVEKDDEGCYWIRDDSVEPIGWVTFPLKPEGSVEPVASPTSPESATSTKSAKTCGKKAVTASLIYADVYPTLTSDRFDSWLHDLPMPEGEVIKGGTNLGAWTYLGYWGRSMGSFKGKWVFAKTLGRILGYVTYREFERRLFGEKKKERGSPKDDSPPTTPAADTTAADTAAAANSAAQ